MIDVYLSELESLERYELEDSEVNPKILITYLHLHTTTSNDSMRQNDIKVCEYIASFCGLDN